MPSLFRLNTRLLLNCLDGISEAHARERPNDRTNSIAFLACHLIDSRHFLGRLLGFAEPNPLEALLRDAASIEDVGELPPLDTMRAHWRHIGTALDACFETLREEDLSAPAPQRFPSDDPTLAGAVGFLLQHESYHIGQLALIRKYLGYPAMRYG